MTKSQTHDRSRLYGPHIATLLERYTNALERCNADRALVFAGNEVLRDRDDQAFGFIADPFFQQWIPLPDAAGCIIEVRPGDRPHLILAHDEDFWHAPPRLPPDYVLAHFEVTRTSRARAPGCIRRHTGKTVEIGAAGAARDKHAIADSSGFLADLDYDRAIKTAYEIDCISEANTLAAKGHRAVALALQPGVSEFELHMQYCSATMQSDADLPYPDIIGLNEHAATLHYQNRSTAAPADTHSLLIDAGARCNGYASDVTRTYSVADGPFSALIDAIDALQRKICDRAAAGVDFVELNDFCHELLAGVLAEFEFIGCTAETAFETGATTAFLPHGLGHLLGLQVHDVGGGSIDRAGTIRRPPDRHPYLRLTRKLENDMVVTIEPGLYFIERLVDEFDRKNPGIIRRASLGPFWRCGGIRIEDNLRVESRGHTNLTRIAFGE